MDAGHNFTTKKAAPSVEAATDKCQALEELATRQVKRVNAAHQAMAQETKRLDDLQQRFSEVTTYVHEECRAYEDSLLAMGCSASSPLFFIFIIFSCGWR